MSESLYSQIAAAEDALRASEQQLGRMRNLRESLVGIVGRGEAADGKIVVEYTSSEGMTVLEIDPYAMRMGSAELADAIKTAVRAAQTDLQDRVRTALAEIAPDLGAMPSADEVREQLAASRERVVDTARNAADGIAEANRLSRERGAF